MDNTLETMLAKMDPIDNDEGDHHHPCECNCFNDQNDNDVQASGCLDKTTKETLLRTDDGSAGGACSQHSLVTPTENTVKFCFKCKIMKAEIFIRGLIACSRCFRVYLEGNVRNSLRLKCNVSRGARTVLCFSGGDRSTALLHILMTGNLGTMEQWNKTLGLNFHSIIHIDLNQLFTSRDREQDQLSFVIPTLEEEEEEEKASIRNYSQYSMTARRIDQFLKNPDVNRLMVPVEILSPLELAFPQTTSTSRFSSSLESLPCIDHSTSVCSTEIRTEFDCLNNLIRNGRTEQQRHRWVLEDLIEIVK